MNVEKLRKIEKAEVIGKRIIKKCPPKKKLKYLKIKTKKSASVIDISKLGKIIDRELTKLGYYGKEDIQKGKKKKKIGVAAAIGTAALAATPVGRRVLRSMVRAGKTIRTKTGKTLIRYGHTLQRKGRKLKRI